MGFVKVVRWLSKNFAATALKNVGVINGIVRLAKMIILRCLRVYCKLVVLLVVMAMTGYLIPKTLKWRFNDKNNETS